MQTAEKYFMTVAEEKGISSAARVLYITQQSLSEQMQKLEQLYGSKLFLRKPRFQLTQEGEALYRTLQKVRILEDGLQTELTVIRDKQHGLLNIGIHSVLAILADEDVMLVAGDTVTAAVALLYLVAPVDGLVVEETHAVAIDVILHVDHRALQYEEVVYLGHVADAERVNLIYQLLLERRGSMRQFLVRLPPALQTGIILAEHRLVFLLGEVLAGVLVELVDELGAELDHLLHGEVARERTVLEAVDAILLILRAVGIGAKDFLSERHSAALAKFLFHSFLPFNLSFSSR